MWLCLEALTTSVGTVPTRLAFDYLAPSAWASIGTIAAKLDDIWKKVSTQVTRLNTYNSEVATPVDAQVKLGREDFYKQLEDFKMAFIQASRGLGGKLDNLELRMIGMGKNLPAAPAPQVVYQQQAANAPMGQPDRCETIVIGDDDPMEIL
jgi:hypothetical protein